MLNQRRRAGFLLPACSSILLLLACTRAAAQTPGYDSTIARLGPTTIQPGTDKDGAQLLKRLNGVIVENKAGAAYLSSLNISGMGERYNQVLFNGAPLPSFSPTGRAWPLDLIPVETIEEVRVFKIASSSIPAGAAGGTIAIRTRDMPDHNFFYIKAGGGFSSATTGKDFYSDKRSGGEWLSFPGSVRNLPGAFPTTRSQFSLDQLNPQEQVAQSKALSNNLAPVNHGSAKPNDNVALAFGRVISLKKGETIGILALINHQGAERIDGSTVQAVPDLPANLYPFADGSKPLVKSLSEDIHYRYTSQLGATLNASILFGNSKISLKNFFSHRFTNTYTRRSQLFKPDEDSLAHTGINYLTEQTTFLHTQLSGEHALGGDGKFKLSWQASYAYLRQQNPDERNFLLRQDTVNGNTYEIARPQVILSVDPLNPNSQRTIDPSFTNSARQWRDATEHNFTGSVGILVPFHVSGQEQVLSGGVSIQSKYRVLHSDLLLTRGTGYYSLNDLLAPERYFPGGLTVANYFINGRSIFAASNSAYIDGTNRGNYVASSNLGSAYIMLEDHLMRSLSLNWGLRLESNSQLVSSTQYAYSAGFKNPQLLTIDENTRVTNTDVLPSVELVYRPLSKVQLHAAGFRTVSRPELQELSAYRHYDALSFMVTTGNQLLANSLVSNYDIGVDWFPHTGSHIAVAGFYKKIDQPIENILSPYSNSVGNLASTPYNTPSADVRGLTASFRTNLSFIADAGWLTDLTFFAGGSWLTSSASGGAIKSTVTPNVVEHKLSGSPDRTMNAGVVIQVPRCPMLTVLYNRIGDYISALGSGTRYRLPNAAEVSAIPDYRVKDRDQLDIQISQKLFKARIQLIAGVNNLTNSAYTEYQDLNGNKKYDQPLSLIIKNNSGGFFNGGVDNTVLSIKAQRTYYLTVSYLFR
ncbi:TonB-dependent receptor plug domain-containing protein [Flavitalea sp. BT771]|uniref:TonB-dependent receptor plug domain-containing protein n=1 Tax=Flavitalea sp. BT771 TaxID=3063329 RepID=UPI0026E1BAD7|nr:TonB-dependent receptor plug domain-containing protein [Flavitalea sp. BT771]MDO6430395.1 TonB-dependent receptor plug domain-containing protein [Flavitalea sp. BT771]MDV6219465.1 TonB-dependent receptor plug domain-containing protein [Flavitalea sp. BT771]